jgi:hypothetical protein
MDKDAVDSHLTRAAACLDSGSLKTNLREIVDELRFCENALVANRFVRSKAANGVVIRVRVAAVDAALIYVSRALSLMGSSVPNLEEARGCIESARMEVAHIG